MTSGQRAVFSGMVRRTWIAACGAAASCTSLLAQASPTSAPPRAAALEGVASDSVMLGSYLRAVAFGDTALLVADSRAGQLFLFDGRLGLTRAFGHAGEGPGEFRVAAAMGALGDDAWLFDPTQGRLTRYARTGALVSSRHPTPPQHAPGPYLGGVVIGAESDTSLIWEFDVAQVALAGAAPVRHTILRAAPDGGVLDTLASFDRQSETWPIAGPAGSTAILPNPFSYSPLWKALPDGAGVVVVTPDRAPDRTRGSFNIEWHRSGRQVSRITVAYRPRLLRTAWADSMARRTAEPLLAGGFSLADVRRAMDLRLRLPTYLPPVTALLTSEDGRAWIRREDPDWTQVEWAVYAPDGTLVARFTVPSNVQGIAARDNVLWGLQTDSLGGERLVRYRF